MVGATGVGVGGGDGALLAKKILDWACKCPRGVLEGLKEKAPKHTAFVIQAATKSKAQHGAKIGELTSDT